MEEDIGWYGLSLIFKPVPIALCCVFTFAVACECRCVLGPVLPEC